MLAWAQAPTGSVHGSIPDYPALRVAETEIRLVPVGESARAQQVNLSDQRSFRFDDVAPGWYIVAAQVDAPERLKALHVDAGEDVDVGEILPSIECPICDFAKLDPPPPVRVLSVCEALTERRSSRDPIIIVGIFKSGMDQTLRQDCPNELRSGDVGWLSAIALSGSTEPPDQYRDQIEKKKAEIYASYPPEAKPRTERLVGLYGILIMPDGLTSAPCCRAAAETTFAPARLIGINEKDFRVIR